MKQYKIYTSLLLVAAAIAFNSCSDWLDVQPTDKVLEPAIYKTERGINGVLNGFYMDMATDAMYGGTLTQTMVDVLAQYYTSTIVIGGNTHQIPTLPQFAEYRYTEKQADITIGVMWKKAYQMIFNINNFIVNVEKSDVMPTNKKELVLGEAYALRAMIHFDLFRLFGPIYKTNPTDLSIPYNTNATASNLPNLEATEFMQKVLEDLDKSEELLKNDPIITEGRLDEDELAVNTSYLFRNKRMNYYAAKALKARVLQYKGDHEGAATLATQIINEAGIKSIFGLGQIVQPNNKFDFIDYQGVLFGIENMDLYLNWTKTSFNENNGQLYLVRNEILIRRIFGIGESSSMSTFDDKRTRAWKNALSNGDSYSISYKFAGRNTDSQTIFPSDYFQPLIRISEMYYIIAEYLAEKEDYNNAAKIINLVMKTRGRQAQEVLLSETSSDKSIIDEELKREYYREFYGEGQVFFFHKRRNETWIMSGEESNVSFGMSEFQYVLPLPTVETDVD